MPIRHLAAAAATVLVACQGDACEQLCQVTTDAMRVCMPQWPAEWDDLDAAGPQDFERTCDNRWAEVRNDLEPRELEDALDQCGESELSIRDQMTAGDGCDLLRALYID